MQLCFYYVIDIAHGNFTAEPSPPTDAPVQGDVYVEKQQPAAPQDELPGNYQTNTNV